FRGQRRLARPLGDYLAAALHHTALPIEIIVPVPLHCGRQRERGYNQAALLARACALRCDLPYHDSALVRTRATPPQTGLSAADRRVNVAGAFALRDRASSEE